MRVLVIGLTRELPLAPADAMDIADKLVARAANAHTEGTAYVCISYYMDVQNEEMRSRVEYLRRTEWD